MTQLLGDVVLWVFCVVAVIHIIVIALKTQWFRYASGRPFFLSKLGLALTAIFIAGRRLGWIPPEASPWFYFIVFGILSCAWIANILLILTRNKKFWAWSK